MNEKTKTTSIRIEQKDYEKLEQIARKQCRSVNKQIEFIIKEYIHKINA